MANWNNPTLTSSYTNFVTEVKDRDVEVALWFEGMSPTNLPTNAKRLNTSTGRFEKWNGSAWVDAVATFTFPALLVPGAASVGGALTLPGGTANGVAYLNGSKVLTTGSALTFDGATLTNGGNIVALGGDFSGQGASGYVQLRAGSSDANTMIIRGASAGARFEYVINGSEQMRLTSTGLGIGTSSPAYKLDVTGSGYFSDGVKIGTNSTAGSGRLFNNATWGMGFVAASASTNAMGWFDSGVNTLMVLSSSGNLGLGVTPSAWGNTVTAFSTGKASLAGGKPGLVAGSVLAHNAYYNGSNWLYQTTSTDGAAKYEFDLSHRWYTAPSGTAGNAISFTQSLTLDASANLIAGGTGYWQIPNGTTAQRPTGAAGQIRFNTTLSRYEGHNGSAWSSIGGGATGGGSDDVFYENGQTVTTNYTLTTNKNAMSAGPITIASGITVTVPSGSTWVVV